MTAPILSAESRAAILARVQDWRRTQAKTDVLALIASYAELAEQLAACESLLREIATALADPPALLWAQTREDLLSAEIVDGWRKRIAELVPLEPAT